MLDRSIPTREAWVHSIVISKVKDMESDVLLALKAFLSEMNSKPCLGAQFEQFSRNTICIGFKFLSVAFPLLGSIFLKSV
jgi:hypothetical protein